MAEKASAGSILRHLPPKGIDQDQGALSSREALPFLHVLQRLFI